MHLASEYECPLAADLEAVMIPLHDMIQAVIVQRPLRNRRVLG
jgi:hypothetical protein